MEWLLLIHQIPAKPAYFRAKILRRLQQLGAVAIKQSVYALPEGEQSREDFTWLIREIIDNGGEAVLLAARFQAGMDDRQVAALFAEARKGDYERIEAEAAILLRQWRETPGAEISGQRAAMARLRKALAGVRAIDFFPGQGQQRAEAAIAGLEEALRRQDAAPASVTGRHPMPTAGATWVTRAGVYADRMACAWLIQRCIDPQARLKFVADARYQAAPGEIRFDMAEAEYSHQGELCSFEVMLRSFGLTDPALARVGQVIHDIDLKESAFGLPETGGIQALFDGIAAAAGDDPERIARAAAVLDSLLAFYRLKTTP